MSEVFRAVPDMRDPKKTEISLHDAALSGFACMHFQDPSLLQFQQRLEDEQQANNLASSSKSVGHFWLRQPSNLVI